MGMNYFTNPIELIFNTVFSLYIGAVMLRFLLQWCRADFRNPISKFLIMITHPPLKILRRFVPSFGSIDTSSLVLMFALQIVADGSVGVLQGVSFSIGSLILVAAAHLIALLLNVFFYAVFARALLSWFNQGSFNDVSMLLYSLTEPLLATCRSVLPNLGGLDLSVILVILGIQVIEMLILPPLYQLASLIS
ncbi:MAG: YggT family protein [Methylococcales bacterium]|nr:YggT family protein [Methylococcales bacterium]MDD5754404.1 YggT family protein [Methylococcales bacterium]